MNEQGYELDRRVKDKALALVIAADSVLFDKFLNLYLIDD
jgi:hypothetical protein